MSKDFGGPYRADPVQPKKVRRIKWVSLGVFQEAAQVVEYFEGKCYLRGTLLREKHDSVSHRPASIIFLEGISLDMIAPEVEE